MDRYFAVVDDRFDVKNPITVIRVVEGTGPNGVTELDDDAAWVRTTLLDRIEAGESPYRLRSIKPKEATRIRERRQQKIAFRYFIVVHDDDPKDTPLGVLREWDAPGGTYAETYTRAGEWQHSNLRLDIERASDLWSRLVPSDAATIHQFIESLHRQWGQKSEPPE